MDSNGRCVPWVDTQQRRMKRVEPQDVFVVHSGEPWPHEQPPCSRQMIKYLERNEDIVTWVQARSLLLSGCMLLLLQAQVTNTRGENSPTQARSRISSP